MNQEEWEFMVKRSSTQSCCGGKGNIRWSHSNKQWSCADCGSVKSNDPDYWISNKSVTPETPLWTSPKCECGGTKAKTTHAHWCDVKN